MGTFCCHFRPSCMSWGCIIYMFESVMIREFTRKFSSYVFCILATILRWITCRVLYISHVCIYQIKNNIRGGGGGGNSCTLLLPARPKLLYTLFYSGIGVGVHARDSTSYIGQNISTSKKKIVIREKINRTVPRAPPPRSPSYTPIWWVSCKTKGFARSFLYDEFILKKFIRRFYNKIL